MRSGIEREERLGLYCRKAGSTFWVRNKTEDHGTGAITIFEIDPSKKRMHIPANLQEQFYQLADTQSIGVAIQNMLIASTELDLGTLWNCDI